MQSALHSILSDTQAGQAAFFLLAEWHHIVDDGHAGGHFLNEWKALISRCEKIQVKSFRGMHIWMRKNSVQNAISGVLANPSVQHTKLCVPTGLPQPDLCASNTMHSRSMKSSGLDCLVAPNIAPGLVLAIALLNPNFSS